MVTIFALTSQTGTDSVSLSEGFTNSMVKIFWLSFSQLSEGRQYELVSNLQFIVRKIAHVTIYTGLGALLYGGVSYFLKNPLLTFLVSWFFGTVFAALDEWHQLSVPGRTGQLSDVMIDSCGVCIGCMLGCLLSIVIKKAAARAAAKRMEQKEH